MTWSVALRLGRVSNLPTIWTNTLAGVVLAGQQTWRPGLLVLLLALSLFYIAGMYLNDAFDRNIDARERPERPIPAGQVGVATVFATGLVMMAAGLALLLWLGHGLAGGTGWRPFLSGLTLGAAILVYDWRHKDNPLSPFLMGLCRMLVYVTAGFAVVAQPPGMLFLAALILLGYLIGVTSIAKQENLGQVKNLWPLLFLAAPAVYGLSAAGQSVISAVLLGGFVAWTLFALNFLRRRRAGDIPRAVVSLLAGISLVDGLFIAGMGAAGLAFLALAGFSATLLFQRFVPGT
ncbi:MAG: UbiA family prenyltransferase [Kiloniellaceae bacterium]